MEEAGLQESWKFNTPFYYYKTKWFCFISYNAKKDHEIYISFVKGGKISHPELLSEGRKQMKIYYVDPKKDIDIKELKAITELHKSVY